MRSLRLVLVLLAAVFAAFAAPADARTQYGVHMDLTWDGDAARRHVAILQAREVLHADISRNSLLWHLIEQSPGRRDWSRTDAVVDELSANGIEPMFAVYGSPAWANGTRPGTPDGYLYVPRGGAAYERWLRRYRGFVRAAVRRYKGRVHKWELWNEPNLHWNWKPRPNLRQYSRFYRTMRRAVLVEDPHAQVAMGSLAGIVATARDNIRGLDFLKGLNRRGIHPEYVNVHPYPNAQQAPDKDLPYENNFSNIEVVRDYLERTGHPVPIWVTEWGWDTTRVSYDKQADYVARSLRIIDRRYPYVTVATTFVNYDRAEYPYGLFDAKMRPKPAAFAFGRFAAR